MKSFEEFLAAWENELALRQQTLGKQYRPSNAVVLHWAFTRSDA